MRRPLTFMVTVLAGVLLGLLLAQVSLDIGLGFNRLEFGPWSGDPRFGGINADPYSKAALIRSGELPLGGGEGITLIAERDSQGRPLNSDCTYEVDGTMPPARFWTITATRTDGTLFDNPAKRHGFTSGEVMRSDNGAVSLSVSPDPQAGNWLPVARNTRLRLTLRLYDTPLANAASGFAPAWPVIRARGCQ